jgi:hypothetical protein
MKKIEIQGKRNQDKMKQMDDPGAVIERKTTKSQKICISDDFYSSDQSLTLEFLNIHIADISLGTGLPEPPKIFQTNEEDANKVTAKSLSVIERQKIISHIIRDIDAKRKSYIYQDKHHNIYDPRYTITTNKIVEHLIEAKLLCYYCREICQVIYKEAMCRKQWTLDRIDNNYGHNDANVVIACLDCNLKRGTMDAERFRQGKQFTFRKIE